MKKISVLIFFSVLLVNANPSEKITQEQKEKLEKITAQKVNQEKDFWDNYKHFSYLKTFGISVASSYIITTAIGAIGLKADTISEKEIRVALGGLVGAITGYYGTRTIKNIQWKQFTQNQACTIHRSENDEVFSIDLKDKGSLDEANALSINRVHKNTKQINDLVCKYGSLLGIASSFATLAYLTTR